jgi:hypothetical protein
MEASGSDRWSDQNYMAFVRDTEWLRHNYAGQYVAYRGGKFVASSRIEGKLALQITRDFPGQAAFIAYVGVESPLRLDQPLRVSDPQEGPNG